MNKGTQKDLKYQVDMSQVLGGYLGDVTIAQSFIENGRDQLNIDFTDNLNPIIQNDYQIYCCSKG